MRFSLFIFLWIFISVLHAQKQKNSIELPPYVKSGKLRNGLTYLIMQNKTPENRAELRLVVRSGSLNEDEDQQGLAHFVEHMCFNGTRNFSKTSLVDFLESTGTRFGPDLNAYTSFDETVYILQVRTDTAGLLEKGLLILEDWAGYVSFEPDEIDKERGVILSEWRTRTGGNERISKITFPVVFRGSRYPDRFPIGKTDIIQNAPYEAFTRYYRDWYRPDLMTVVVVGDVDVQTVEKIIRRRFSKLKRAKRPRLHYSQVVPLTPGARVITVTDPEIQSYNLSFRFMRPEIDYFADGGVEQNFLIGIANMLMGMRIQDFLANAQSKAINANAFIGNTLGTASALTFSVLPKNQQWYEASAQIFNIIKTAADHPANDAELEHVKRVYRQRLESAVKVKEKTPSNEWTANLVSHALRQSPFIDPEERLKRFDEWAESLTAETVRKLIADYFYSETWAATAVAPESDKKHVPNDAQLMAAVYYFLTNKTFPYIFNPPAPKLQVTSATYPDETLSILPENRAGYKGFALANGMEFYIRRVPEEKDRIIIDGFLFGGNSPFADSLLPAANYLMQTVFESGVGQHDIIELRKLLAGKRVNIYPYLSNYYHGINGFCSPDELETAFQLIRLYLTETRIDEEALGRVKTREINLLQGLYNNPDTYFGRELNRILYNNNPRATTPTVEQVEKITITTQRQLWQALFGAPARLRWIITGDVDEEKVKALAIKYLSDLQNKTSPVNLIDRNLRISARDTLYELRKGENPRSQVRLVYHGKLADPADEFQLKTAVEVLKIKLREELREEKSGVYGVSVFYNVNSPFNDEYTIVIAFNTDPARRRELTQAARDVLAKNAQQIDAETLRKVQELLRQDIEKGRTTAQFWHNLMQGYIKFSKPESSADVSYQRSLIDALTADQVSLWIMRYAGGRPIVLVLDPETASQ
ncbi:MAG: M16 family metallopeptidase [Thermaurantimonas sp.]|uniref:M16 family metallopeptidase n=1 Tax=Thermaurantimonas sp. TaxID=2681568 RepID=UPI00391BEA78